MPTYEYRCDNGHTFEVMQRMTDDALDKCIECGAPAQRVFHAPAVHFKGSGFYNTDYGKKTKGATAPASEKKSESSSSGDSSSKPSDSKPAAKPSESKTKSSD